MKKYITLTDDQGRNKYVTISVATRNFNGVNAGEKKIGEDRV